METTSRECGHGFTFGYCPEFCAPLDRSTEILDRRVAEVMKISKENKRRKNPYTKESVIIAMVNLRKARRATYANA